MWDAHGLDTELGAGIGGNHWLFLEGCHQCVRNPKPTFPRAFATALLWWLLKPAGLHWGASATYSKKSQGRLCYWHQCHSQSQQNPSQKPTLYAWSLLRYHLSYLKTATNQRRSWESFQSKPLSDEPHLPWVIHHTMWSKRRNDR